MGILACFCRFLLSSTHHEALGKCNSYCRSFRGDLLVGNSKVAARLSIPMRWNPRWQLVCSLRLKQNIDPSPSNSSGSSTAATTITTPTAPISSTTRLSSASRRVWKLLKPLILLKYKASTPGVDVAVCFAAPHQASCSNYGLGLP